MRLSSVREANFIHTYRPVRRGNAQTPAKSDKILFGRLEALNAPPDAYDELALWQQEGSFFMFSRIFRTLIRVFPSANKAKVTDKVCKTNRISFRSEVEALPDFPSFISYREKIQAKVGGANERFAQLHCLCNSQ